MEKWKEAVGFEYSYEVSTMGRIRNKRNKNILVFRTDYMGYAKCNLYSHGRVKTCRVHRIVAETFIPNPDKKRTVDHINGIKTDNRVENLRWATSFEQMHNPVTSKDKKPLQDKNDYKRRVLILFPNGEIKTFDTIINAAKAVNTSRNRLSGILNGKRKNTSDFVAKFV